MHVIRPIDLDDLHALHDMALSAGAGFTSLPPESATLKKKIERSRDSFDESVDAPGAQRYMFVLEDTTSGTIGGCCAIEAACGLDEPFYNYHVGLTVHASQELGVYNRVPTLYLSNDLTGCSVLCSLYLAPEFRSGGVGYLLSKSRFLFMATFPQRFADKVIAEMRGVSDSDGKSPFWEGLGRHFFSIEYDDAEHIVGQGNKACIAELMPRHPIYSPLLTPSAQAVMGQVHPQTAPALRLLTQEGFRYQGYIDIFDGGPTVEAPVSEVQSIRRSRVEHIVIGAVGDNGTDHLIANLELGRFRCVLATLEAHDDHVVVSRETAQALQLDSGDSARIVAL